MYCKITFIHADGEIKLMKYWVSVWNKVKSDMRMRQNYLCHELQIECCDQTESLEVISDNSNRTNSSTRLRKSSSMTSTLQSSRSCPPSDRSWSFSSIRV